MLDLTKYINQKSYKNYSGSTENDGVIIDGFDYLIKYQDKMTKHKINETSYRNNVISEYVACKIIKLMNYPVQDVLIGYILKNNIKKEVVACKDFTELNEILFDFNKVHNSQNDKTKEQVLFNSLELDDIISNIDLLNLNNLTSKEIANRFYEQFVIDAFIGNYDRHNGNWGYVLNKENRNIRLAPLYDCGSSFDSKLNDEYIETLIKDDKLLKNHILNISKSCITINNKNIRYYEFFNNTNDINFLSALNKIYKLIDLDKINTFIKKDENIPDLQKDYFIKYLSIKYDFLLQRNYKKFNDINFNNIDLSKVKFEDVDTIKNNLSKYLSNENIENTNTEENNKKNNLTR